jgi:hypothetical protein
MADSTAVRREDERVRLKKQMRYLCLAILSALLLITISPSRDLRALLANPSMQENTLTNDERKAGWKLLFDCKTTNGWRGYKKQSVPPGWKWL